MVLFDNNFLSVALHPDALQRFDVPEARERIELLLEHLQDGQEKIAIPTPVLAEFLVLADQDAPKYLDELRKNSIFRICNFDQMAAIELASLELAARHAGKSGAPLPRTTLGRR